MKKTANKTALITGGSQGIGYGIASALIDEGYNVAVLGRTRQKLDAAVQQLNTNAAGKAIGVQADVTCYESQKQAVKKVVASFGQINIVVANAGFWKAASLDNLSLEQWNQTIATNLTGVFYTLKAGMHQLKTHQGYFFAMSSLTGAHFLKGCSAHVASKFGVAGFAQAALLDLRPYGIKTSVLMPGSVATHFDEHTPKEKYSWKIQPEDIGRIVVDLLQMNPRCLPSKVEVRPSFPPGK